MSGCISLTMSGWELLVMVADSWKTKVIVAAKRMEPWAPIIGGSQTQPTKRSEFPSIA